MANENLDIDSKTAEELYEWYLDCLLYTSDAADDRISVDLGGRGIIKKKKSDKQLLRTAQMKLDTGTHDG
ncbi:hypothetical protein, partial [Escherichia coli]|uniref:hypothetical protein n=1 Tax=Escherichia coli TaxID=562 RepID=UPI0022B02813